MYIYINMCIIMNMNIYIRPDNEQHLRAHKGSMSGLINDLLDAHFSGKPVAIKEGPEEEDNYDLEQMRDLPINEQVEMLGYKWDRTIKMAWDESQERHWPVVVTNGLAEVKAA